MEIILQIAKIALEHKESSEIIARQLGLTEDELDAIYESIANQHI